MEYGEYEFSGYSTTQGNVNVDINFKRKYTKIPGVILSDTQGYIYNVPSNYQGAGITAITTSYFRVCMQWEGQIPQTLRYLVISRD